MKSCISSTDEFENPACWYAHISLGLADLIIRNIMKSFQPSGALAFPFLKYRKVTQKSESKSGNEKR